MVGESKKDETQSVQDNKSDVAAPSITLPKGGGAIRGLGEKFAANPVTGTGSMTVPIATSPSRSGFGPQLSLSYDSGAGNGAFGLGWNLSLPAISRKTDKGLPRYADTENSDVFLLSGAEDLVPVLVHNGKSWVSELIKPRVAAGKTYNIQRYRPRIEGLFARIEHWSNQADPSDTFWRSITKDNLTTWYGKTSESRIADPSDSTRIFSWLICESYDDKGNVIVYGYKAENSDLVDRTQPHEANRSDVDRSANRYLKRILYGNRIPFFPELTSTSPWPTPPGAQSTDASPDWCFKTIFDYGEHDLAAPKPDDSGTWTVRPDPFSSYRSTFEVRTYRLCRRVLMFHHFPGDANVGAQCLVRSTDFTYAYQEALPDPLNPIYTFLLKVTQTSYRLVGAGYQSKSLPPIEFEYTQPIIDTTIREIDAASLENLPYGLDGGHYQWLDLNGEGLSGILTEQGGNWFYKRNLSPVRIVEENGKPVTLADFAPLQSVPHIPSSAIRADARHQMLDLAGDDQLDVVEFEPPTPGFFERTEEGDWNPFIPFTSLPNLGYLRV